MRPAALSYSQGRLWQNLLRVWAVLVLAAREFVHIDGAQLAGAFAFNASFSLFPLMILLVTVVLSFVDRDIAAKEIIASMAGYVPISGENDEELAVSHV